MLVLPPLARFLADWFAGGLRILVDPRRFPLGPSKFSSLLGVLLAFGALVAVADAAAAAAPELAGFPLVGSCSRPRAALCGLSARAVRGSVYAGRRARRGSLCTALCGALCEGISLVGI